jgi:hypothetical protein
MVATNRSNAGLEIRDFCDNRGRRRGIRFVTQERSNTTRDREVENTGGNRAPKLIIAAAAAGSTKRKLQAGAA